MDRDEAAARAVREFLRHQVTLRRAGVLLSATLAAAVLSALALHPVFGPVGVLLAAIGHTCWVEYRSSRWAKGAIRAAAPTLGRLRVVVLMTYRTRTGCDRAMFTRLLANAPEEMSCAALGRHLPGYCPHANIAW